MLESNNAQTKICLFWLKSNTSQIKKLIFSLKSNTCQIGQHTFSLKSNINQISRLDFLSNQMKIKYFFVKIKSNKLKLESFIKYGSNNHNRIFKIVYKLISSFPIRRKRESLAYYGSKYFQNCIQFMLWNNTNC